MVGSVVASRAAAKAKRPQPYMGNGLVLESLLPENFDASLATSGSGCGAPRSAKDRTSKRQEQRDVQRTFQDVEAEAEAEKQQWAALRKGTDVPFVFDDPGNVDWLTASAEKIAGAMERAEHFMESLRRIFRVWYTEVPACWMLHEDALLRVSAVERAWTGTVGGKDPTALMQRIVSVDNLLAALRLSSLSGCKPGKHKEVGLHDEQASEVEQAGFISTIKAIRTRSWPVCDPGGVVYDGRHPPGDAREFMALAAALGRVKALGGGAGGGGSGGVDRDGGDGDSERVGDGDE